MKGGKNKMGLKEFAENMAENFNNQEEDLFDNPFLDKKEEKKEKIVEKETKECKEAKEIIKKIRELVK